MRTTVDISVWSVDTSRHLECDIYSAST